jgi:hypothetical protein
MEREYNRRYKEAHPDRRAAQLALDLAILRGEIIRPKFCACGNPRPQGHHQDYLKPLAVDWACKKCHAKLDAQRRERERS